MAAPITSLAHLSHTSLGVQAHNFTSVKGLNETRSGLSKIAEDRTFASPSVAIAIALYHILTLPSVTIGAVSYFDRH